MSITVGDGECQACPRADLILILANHPSGSDAPSHCFTASSVGWTGFEMEEDLLVQKEFRLHAIGHHRDCRPPGYVFCSVIGETDPRSSPQIIAPSTFHSSLVAASPSMFRHVSCLELNVPSLGVCTAQPCGPFSSWGFATEQEGDALIRT
jgi:hypothetical protein